ncbi:LOW QUALITY PROTEIN: uncharacterized protein LOC132949739 [Metopolophium dirhodum]|uniref:LOW QUALITY PROTEIN: uncharacterized protein LOC132949739 n=1 Tax=Metopolophium dirhodum TaxID=44670 RepID=UPI0029900B74|nr:LOW QUALITY PROTEIN: uncharacterized protein LOC132949739 [Metopolophium dirhodum]
MCVKRLLFTVSQRRETCEYHDCVTNLTMTSLNNLSTSDVNRLRDGRKRKINMTDWKNVKNKTLRNSGKEYTSQSKKLVPAKTPPTVDQVCDQSSCPWQGCATMTLARKLLLFDEFYKLTYDEQSAFLYKCIKVNAPVRRRPGKTDATSRRFCSFKYYIDDLQVCKNTLLNTFCIIRRRVMTLQDKIKLGIITPRDNRGKHLNRPHAIDAPVRDLIRLHINSLPRQPSHYSRIATDNLQCLSSDLNLCKLYRSFKNKYPDINVSKRIYRNIFRSDFKLRFGYPRSDTCKQCDFFYNKLVAADTEEESKKIEIDSKLHHSKAEQSYDALKKDTDIGRLNSSIVVLCVDLQQVLFCPTLTHSNMFYQRQLSNYNLAIHNVANARLEKPFRIIEMSQNDFKDFSALEQDITKKNLKITQAMWLKLTADAPKHVNIRENLPPAYEFPVALTKEKKKDLLDMCKYMPQQYSDFYTSLPG